MKYMPKEKFAVEPMAEQKPQPLNETLKATHDHLTKIDSVLDSIFGLVTGCGNSGFPAADFDCMRSAIVQNCNYAFEILKKAEALFAELQ